MSLARILGRHVLAFVLVSCLSAGMILAPAAAQQQPATDAQINLLMESGDYAGALALAERVWGPDTPNRRARIEFIRGMKVRAEGDLQGAIAIFRALLTDNPGFTRVRVELANTLVMAGDGEAASYHLRDLARTAQSDDLRRGFEAYLDAIKRDRPWRVGGYISLAPSTNVNGRTTEQFILLNIPGVGCPNDLCAFVIDQGSRAASGIGLSGGISGDRHFFLSDKLTVTLSGRIDATKYTQNQFDRLNASGGVHLRHKSGDSMIGGGVVAEYQNIGHSTYREAGGLEFEYGLSLDRSTHLLLSTSLLYQRFPGFPIMDGLLASVGATIGHGIGPGQSVTAGMRFTAERTGAPYLDNNGVRLFAGYGREWKGGFITYVEPSATARSYLGIDPTFGVIRRDIEIGGRIALSHRKLNFMGFMPRLEYSYTKQFSTIVFQRRETHAANVVMTREF